MGTAARMTRVRATAKNAFTEPPSTPTIVYGIFLRRRKEIFYYILQTSEG